MSAVFFFSFPSLSLSSLSHRRGLCKWFIACQRHGEGDRGGETRAFMRLTQSKLLGVISLAEDIGSQKDRGNIKCSGEGGVGFTVSSGIREHNNQEYGQKVLNVFQGK